MELARPLPRMRRRGLFKLAVLIAAVAGREIAIVALLAKAEKAVATRLEAAVWAAEIAGNAVAIVALFLTVELAITTFVLTARTATIPIIFIAIVALFHRI